VLGVINPSAGLTNELLSAMRENATIRLCEVAKIWHWPQEY